ncbi:DNA-binding NtrC family response regulator [Parabacteroides sp. PF5-5]|uniref:sigma-54-dependent transcriptional regulator n=1 Tax=unclassified Parabacteroides TaxID=2649774 RepID=UPI0024761721|nr:MULTISPECIES: sigma-54 dependent transcriptional regulator [unclassified Parabacteroides]MDH6303901.1 DNA-binding NtrC family response regulator [Parabacteroides sp. PH5-39]MDH6314518.1 DNA-binding NtrC family response regulator [Parabacteroides sp. PF5-13]MDH6318417.1 DNA-binding NtrC family response regulator [Parabacteroides sp. PH5-13]MDH6322290.1 DNA-binding NtrC family response regulator [Parabacteroides sp. PH5-8]MDH6325630.1 DNA-binding NtrC family response regulator [Parabacteroide
MKGKVLIADDEASIRKVMTLLLKEEGYEVKTVENGREAVDTLLSFNPDVVLLDQQMPLLTGTEAFEEIRKLRPNQVVIFITAFGSIALAVDAVKKGAYDFIEKPFDNDNLLLKVKRAMEHCRMKGEINTLKTRLQANTHQYIIGENSGLKQVVIQVKRVADTNATVLIHGESGTGKELIANAVHKNSNRANEPFIAINCGAIPLSLMESELFGHEKGAFTDAKEAKAGTFEQANGGTLFLDEIGELPMDAQVKLLRVLEERKITRIGGKKAIPVDVRIVAASNRMLEEEVRKGNFRLDLLYRLNIFTITLPPLRERKEDIPLLVDYFIVKHNKVLNLAVKSISQAAMDIITKYDWPGNVRDLENAIQSAMILAPDGIITTEHLPLRVKGYETIETLSASEAEGNSIKEINAQVEKELILEMLKKHNFNRTLTAEALNISRKTLFNKMKRYGIDS